MASLNRSEDRSLIQPHKQHSPHRNPLRGEQGFVLVGALLILVILVLVGISATTSTILELQIAGAERVNRETFHSADGGTQLAARLVEESLGHTSGFTKLTAEANTATKCPSGLTPGVLNDTTAGFTPNTTILVCDNTLSTNEVQRTPSDLSSLTGRAERDLAYYPNGYNSASPNAIPHTNITMSGVTTVVQGAGLQMVAGYEGKGKGVAGGGGQILYTIFSQHMGRSNSESMVEVTWRHIIGLELEGRY